MSLQHTGPLPLAPASPFPARIASEPREAPRAAASRAAIPAALFTVDRLEGVDCAAHRDAWVDLVGRALEPNPFLDPDFALPAAQHLSGRRRPCFALVWAEDGAGRRDLVAVCPIVAGLGPLRGLASAWLHDLSTLGLPLLDRDRADAALSALLAWAGTALRGASGLLVPSLPADGPTAAALRRVAAKRGLDLAVLATWERAALRRGDPADLAAPSARGAKELRRQRRRLAERGALAFASAEAAADLRSEVERFLSLEAGGWKGAAGTAMLSSSGRTAFLRTAVRMLARRGLCRIDGLTLDGAPVAMAVTLRAGDAEFLWKIAYREDVARCSPGVLLVLDLTEAQRRSGRAAAIDSCAVPDHPMIDRLWGGRIRLCDVAVALEPRRGPAFHRAVAVERGARRLRAGVKRMVLGWRARRARRGG